jgi:hypothetical protein
VACGGLGLWLGLRLAQRWRGLDERFKHITQKSLAKAWGVTTLGLAGAFIWLVTTSGHVPPAALWGALYLVQVAGAAVAFVVESMRS